ncbi:MAG: hypothetical protein Q9191_000555 [Dirinaria sp. TL-2023a]
MSSDAQPEIPKSPTTSAPKNKKQKKKKSGAKSRLNGDEAKPNGINAMDGADHNDGTNDEPEPEPEPELEPETPVVTTYNGVEGHESGTEPNEPLNNGIDTGMMQLALSEAADDRTIEESTKASPASNTAPTSNLQQNGATSKSVIYEASAKDTDVRLEALAKEREALRDEVAELRKSLERLQGKHDEEITDMRGQLEETQGEKEHAETQYRTLLGKVNTIKSQLGERLKADAEDLAQTRGRIDELEGQCETLQEQNEARTAELSAMAAEGEQRSKELSSLRNRTTLSQQNWSREREDLVQREAYAKEEFEAAKQAMQDWEVLAMEERSVRENLAEKVADLEEQVLSHRQAHDKAASERDSQTITVDGLQRALQEIQEERRRELREVVENSQKQVEDLQKQLKDFEAQSSEATTALETTKRELERALPFEKEVKEKNLLIGKLRHEAVILNDHLTKALRYLKKGKPDENIDKQLISNHFLHFLALDRADPKKFQILQIIAALLAWSDDQREQAGLARPGASNPSLRVPLSPWHRTPSTPALSTDFFPESSSRKESLAELWSDFLEQEAQEGVRSPKPSDSAKSPKSPNTPSGSKPP